MILIADSGSTNAGWALAEGKEVKQNFRTPGIHPYYQDPDAISAMLKESLPAGLPVDRVRRVCFYGAGCWYPEQQKEVKSGLQPLFRSAVIEVSSDLLGAGRALFGKGSGLAVILGTGASAGVYDRREISDYVKSLGYILGDPGSGAYMGRKLLQHYLEESLPDDLTVDFQGHFRPVTQEILDRIYRGPFPNRYLASFVPFMAERQSHPFIKELVRRGIDRLIDRYIKRLPGYAGLPMGLAGSVAWHFSGTVNEAVTGAGFPLPQIISDPLPGLTKYHLEEQ